MIRFLVLAGMLAVPWPAFAHAFLRHATPAVGSTVEAPPTQLELEFTEGVEPGFSTVEVHDATGTRVDTGELHTAPGDPKTLIVTANPHAAGLYTVEWHVVSVDTHRTQGRYTFKIAP